MIRALAWLIAPCVILPVLGGMAIGGAHAQDPPPAPSPAPDASDLPTPLSREAQLEARVLQLERIVERLSRQVAQGPALPPLPDSGDAAPDTGTPAELAAPSQTGGPGGPGQSMPPNPPPSDRFNSPATLEHKKANVIFGPGFEIRSDDDEFIFQFHNLTQLDYRGYQQGGQDPVHDTFALPRQWFVFSGRITKPIGYLVSIANGFDTMTALDVFLDIDYDPRARLRVGRMKTPFTYEFYVEPVQGLVLPERSIFFNNFGQNRDLGVMAFGRVFDNRLDYAVGIYNGYRNGYFDNNDAKAISSLLNFKPFANAQGSILENLNVGGSVFAQHFMNRPVPQVFRTIVPMAGNAVFGVPFLALNDDVREAGFAALWDAHVAYFLGPWAVVAEYGGGRQQYAPASNLSQRTGIPVQSFYVESGLLLTGETRSAVGIVKPNRPFDPRPARFGLGAWELTARAERLEIGGNVFSAGFADPNLWSNRVDTVSLGFNWHLNQYTKFMFMWERMEFGSPVQFAPGRFQLTSDLFLARLQLYF